MPYINIFDKLTLDNYYKTDTHWKQEDLFNVANTIANQMNFDITNNNIIIIHTTIKSRWIRYSFYSINIFSY